jgi:hypothetical protein
MIRLTEDNLFPEVHHIVRDRTAAAIEAAHAVQDRESFLVVGLFVFEWR